MYQNLKIIIAGSRTINKYDVLLQAMADTLINYQGFTIEIISGGAIGVDKLAYRYAMENKLIYYEFKPKYKGPKDYEAPLRRNRDMGDILISIWDGKSKGTKYMMDYMEELGKPIYKYVIQI